MNCDNCRPLELTPHRSGCGQHHRWAARAPISPCAHVVRRGNRAARRNRASPSIARPCAPPRAKDYRFLLDSATNSASPICSAGTTLLRIFWSTGLARTACPVHIVRGSLDIPAPASTADRDCSWPLPFARRSPRRERGWGPQIYQTSDAYAATSRAERPGRRRVGHGRERTRPVRLFWARRAAGKPPIRLRSAPRIRSAPLGTYSP